MSQSALFPGASAGSGEWRVQEPVSGEPRLRTAQRDQVELRAVDLESLIGEDHRARTVWSFVEGLDLAPLYAAIRSAGSNPGAPATDPKILLALWLYATLEGVGSARQLERLCEEHAAYQWLCGGVGVNYRTLSDFRVGNDRFLDHALTQSVAALMKAGLVSLERVAQDGVRVRAAAGAASFHRPKTLRRCLREAEAQVAQLKQELEQDPGASTRRRQSALRRAAEERRQRLEAALSTATEIAAKQPKKEPEDLRASSTDPQARVMKMADGGFRPAFNIQFVTDTRSQVVVGVTAINQGVDVGQMSPMLQQLERRYQRRPGSWLADGGFSRCLEDVAAVERAGVELIAPLAKPRGTQRAAHEPRPGDAPEIVRWRERMAADGTPAIYRERAAVAECVNAQARNRGLIRLTVRGLEKARIIATWMALAHNLVRAATLRVVPVTA